MFRKKPLPPLTYAPAPVPPLEAAKRTLDKLFYPPEASCIRPVVEDGENRFQHQCNYECYRNRWSPYNRPDFECRVRNQFFVDAGNVPVQCTPNRTLLAVISTLFSVQRDAVKYQKAANSAEVDDVASQISALTYLTMIVMDQRKLFLVTSDPEDKEVYEGNSQLLEEAMDGLQRQMIGWKQHVNLLSMSGDDVGSGLVSSIRYRIEMGDEMTRVRAALAINEYPVTAKEIVKTQ